MIGKEAEKTEYHLNIKCGRTWWLLLTGSNLRDQTCCHIAPLVKARRGQRTYPPDELEAYELRSSPYYPQACLILYLD